MASSSIYLVTITHTVTIAMQPVSMHNHNFMSTMSTSNNELNL